MESADVLTMELWITCFCATSTIADPCILVLTPRPHLHTYWLVCYFTSKAWQRGQSEGTVRRYLDAQETASFLIAMYEGYVMLAKNAQEVNVWKVGIRNIVGWLHSLRAQ
jgi:hypothetical protein